MISRNYSWTEGFTIDGVLTLWHRLTVLDSTFLVHSKGPIHGYYLHLFVPRFTPNVVPELEDFEESRSLVDSWPRELGPQIREDKGSVNTDYKQQHR